MCIRDSTYGYGLIKLDLNNNQTKFINIESPTFKTLAFKYIKSLHQSKNGTLWIGFWGGGLASFDTKTEQYRIFRHNEKNINSLTYNDVWDLHEDKFGRIWAGTNGGGLNLFIPEGEGRFKSFKCEVGNSNSIISNSINTIVEIPSDNPKETILLIGTENGISKAILKNKNANVYDFDITFENFAGYEIQSNNSVKGIMLDDESNVWISTDNGLTKYNPASKIAFNFNRSNGFNTNIFNSNSYNKFKNGLLIFGSSKGPVIFKPDEIDITTFNPKIVFTDFLIFNKSISPAEDSPLGSSISKAEEIRLSYNQNVFTFKFVSLDFNSPEQINYMYKLSLIHISEPTRPY